MQQLFRQFMGGDSDALRIVLCFLCLSPRCTKLCMRARVLLAIEYDLRVALMDVGNGS